MLRLLYRVLQIMTPFALSSITLRLVLLLITLSFTPFSDPVFLPSTISRSQVPFFIIQFVHISSLSHPLTNCTRMLDPIMEP
jgi:hypothetical protein